jgi:hypothetical protein
MDEFCAIFNQFHELYEKCSSIIALGVDLETTDEQAVTIFNLNSNVLRTMTQFFLSRLSVRIRKLLR